MEMSRFKIIMIMFDTINIVMVNDCYVMCHDNVIDIILLIIIITLVSDVIRHETRLKMHAYSFMVLYNYIFKLCVKKTVESAAQNLQV